MTDEKLRKLQLIQLYMLLELKRICEKHNIKYFLIGGTLLGAVRHKGFIPWDDDIDVAMLRDDYNKFIAICNTELSSDFFLQTRKTDKYCSIHFAKLRLNNTKRVDEGASNTLAHCGIDIDIFPYDNIPADFRGVVQYNLAMMLRGMHVIKANYILLNRERSLKKSMGMIICRILSLFFSREMIEKMIDILFLHYNSKNMEYSMCFAGSSYGYKRDCMRKEVISNYTELQFEGFLFSVPANYNEYLNTLYPGDFMRLPPIEKRVTHSIVELDFGKYDNIEEYFMSLSSEE